MKPQEAKRIIDISPVISEKTAVFPGDEPFSRKVALSFAQGHHLELSAITTTVHIGAHTDAPNHYHPDGESIEARPLDIYFGPCQVIDVRACRKQSPAKKRIMPDDIAGIHIDAPRVLFQTDSFPDPDHWNDDFLALSPELIEYLAAQNVRLVGIDTPSVDPADSKALEAHNAIYKNDLAILEGIVLTAVDPAIYTLVALPLKIKGADASPVRAVLLAD